MSGRKAPGGTDAASGNPPPLGEKPKPLPEGEGLTLRRAGRLLHRLDLIEVMLDDGQRLLGERLHVRVDALAGCGEQINGRFVVLRHLRQQAWSKAVPSRRSSRS